MAIINEYDTLNLKRKVAHYQEVLANTIKYRETWQKSLKEEIRQFLERTAAQVQLACSVDVRADIKNLEAIVLSLGSIPSGLGEPVGDGLHRDLIKQSGSLIYQQLANGKVLVLMNYPFIEKYGQPQQPKTMGIYRPEELKEPYCLRHLEEFITEIAKWEDYDDDLPDANQRIGFKFNFEQQDGQAPG
jgi:hypothetical protein